MAETSGRQSLVERCPKTCPDGGNTCKWKVSPTTCVRRVFRCWRCSRITQTLPPGHLTGHIECAEESCHKLYSVEE